MRPSRPGVVAAAVAVAAVVAVVVDPVVVEYKEATDG